MLRACLAVVLVGGCWSRTPPPPPPKPAPAPVAKVDPCPEQRLREFAAAVDAGIESMSVKPTGRMADTLQVKCPPASTDEACIDHARANAIIPEGWEVTRIGIDNSGEMVGVEVELDVDGTPEVRVYKNALEGAARAKELQAQGKRVTMVRADMKRGGGDRVAHLDLFGPPGPARRVAKIHAMPSGERAAQLEQIHTTATKRRIELLSMAAGPKTIELVVGCAY
ncbi:MAG: hypothetical protein SFX73_37785 [Kofleriaceae bacterium]|nr:hypothetical protein [Kofleriaceae bacterium]